MTYASSKLVYNFFRLKGSFEVEQVLTETWNWFMLVNISSGEELLEFLTYEMFHSRVFRFCFLYISLKCYTHRVLTKTNSGQKTNFHNYSFNHFNYDRFVFYIIHSDERRLFLQGSIDTILRLLIWLVCKVHYRSYFNTNYALKLIKT
jgi:hypothetical protein